MITIHRLAATASTNSDAMARAMAGEPLPFWVSAERQTAGRGRSGREWQSTAGNLHASLAIGLTCSQQLAAQLSLVAGVAVIDALRGLAMACPAARSAAVALKWPNDIEAGGAKLGGILIETTYDFRSGLLIAVIGFGLNVVSCPQINRLVTCLTDLGFDVTPERVLVGLADAMEDAVETWNAGQGFGDIRRRWLAAAMADGTAMTIHAGDVLARGRFGGLDADGALLLRDDTGRMQRFTFGDVTLGL